MVHGILAHKTNKKQYYYHRLNEAATYTCSTITNSRCCNNVLPNFAFEYRDEYDNDDNNVNEDILLKASTAWR